MGKKRLWLRMCCSDDFVAIPYRQGHWPQSELPDHNVVCRVAILIGDPGIRNGPETVWKGGCTGLNKKKTSVKFRVKLKPIMIIICIWRSKGQGWDSWIQVQGLSVCFIGAAHFRWATSRIAGSSYVLTIKTSHVVANWNNSSFLIYLP